SYYLFQRDGHYNNRSLAGLAIFSGIVLSGCALMLFCTIRIYSCLSSAKLISASALRFHRTILVILLIQTVIPILCIHVNVGAYLIAPLFEKEINISRDFTVLIAHLFVPLDAIDVLLLMPEYRRAIAKAIRKR
ncbi:hypothetical protein PMAYCL1PPCAC_00413, partial [Pristionchus mayeri]